MEKETEQFDEEQEAADAAFFAAKNMPRCPERFEALKKAGKMRNEADKRRRASETELRTVSPDVK